MQQDSPQQSIHAGICPKPSQEPENVQRADAYQAGCIFFIPDRFITQKMCIKVVKEYPWDLPYVPDHFKILKMCDTAVSEDPFSLQYVSDCLWRNGN